MKTNLFLTTLLCLFVVCQTSTAKVIKQQRKVTTFSRIESKLSIKINFTQSKNSKVEVETEEDFMDYASVENTGDQLILTLKNPEEYKKNQDEKSTPSVTVYVSSPNLKSISLNTASSFNCDRLKSTNFEVNLSTASRVNINELIIKEGDFKISTASGCNIEKLEADELDISVSTAANFYADVKDVKRINASTNTSASLTLKGKADYINSKTSTQGRANIDKLKYNKMKSN